MKILFNLNDKQHLVEVGPGGSVTSEAEILWDERVHGPIRPDVEAGRMEAYEQEEEIVDSQGQPQYEIERDENGNPILDENGATIPTEVVATRMVWKLRKKQTVLPAHQAIIDQEEQLKTNREARAYLASTDWYIIRMQEAGTPVPQEILSARAAARLSIVE